MTALLIQIYIFVTSVTAVYFLTSKPTHARWGSLVGLCGQPAWLYVTAKGETWGVFAVSVWFLFCYYRGVARGFFPLHKQ